MKLKLKRHEKKFLQQYARKGNKSARALKRATILLLLNNGETGNSIAQKLDVNRDTVYNVKGRYVREGVEAAIHDKPRSGQPPKYSDKHKAEIIAHACTTPPEGRKRWTVRLLAEEMRPMKGFKTINRETIRLTLKKATPSLG